MPIVHTSLIPVQQLIRLWIAFITTQLGDRPLDPYAIWGLITRFRVLGQSKRLPSVLTFNVELKGPYTPGKHAFPLTRPVRPAASASWGSTWPVRVPSAYAHSLPATGVAPSFVTLRLDVDGRTWDDVRQDVCDLILNSEVKRLQIGLPRGVDNADPGQGVQPVPLPGWVKDHKVLIGVIDDTCPFAHRALRLEADPLSTRVVSLWDQTTLRRLSGGRPLAPMGFPYGMQWSHGHLNGLLQAHLDGSDVDEAAVYAAVPFTRRPLALRASHAAAVVTLLAGGGRAAPRMPQPLDSGDTPLSLGEPLDDHAARAPLAVVQLPAEQTAVRAGRWLAVNALDGLHHLMGVARQLGDQVGQPPVLVTNMSYGAMAGPHDGTGMLESAIDELCQGSKDGLAVVVSAGNAHGTRRKGEEPLQYEFSGMHARQALAPGGSVTFTLFIPPDKQFETYVEFWFSVVGEAGDKDQFLEPGKSDGSAGEVEIVVTPPEGAPWPALHCPGVHAVPAPDNNKEAEAGLFFMRKPTQGLHRSMALLVVAATQVASRHVEAPSGRWQITLQHKQAANDLAARHFQVDAWVERDDTEVGAVRPQSARLVANADGSPDGLTDENTFSSIATGSNTFRVGAVMDRGAGLATERVSAYSAAAVSDREGPEYSAIADAHPALPGIRVSGSQSGMVLRANGTSMAAPQAARHLVNKLVGGSTPKTEHNALKLTGRGNARLGKKTV
jgi:hypothetical protein